MSARSASAYGAAKASGSASKAIRRRTTSTRSAGSRGAATSTVSPNRSSSCGRSSPSSGFMVPTSTNRAACSTETPSRSTVDRPIAAASSSRSTRWSCSRLTSSTYRIPRWARASRPGSYSALPSDSARSRCSEPSTRSSVAPTGSSTSRTGRVSVGASAGERPVGRQRRRVARVAGEPVAGDDLDRRQHGGQGAHDRRLRRALLAAHQHAADLGRDRGEDQGQRHRSIGPSGPSEPTTALKGNCCGM